MKISCSHCKTRYTVPDSKIKGRKTKLRCRKCGNVTIIDATNPGLAARKDTGEENRGWYFGLDGDDIGPVSLGEAEELVRKGRITADHFVWRDGFSDWLPVENVPEVARLLEKAGREVERQQMPEGGKKAVTEEDVTILDGSTEGGGGSTSRHSRRSRTKPRLIRQKVSDDDEQRKQLLLKVARKRERVRQERQADRIAEHFFRNSLEEVEASPLPPPPVDDSRPELEAGGHDPLSQLVEPELLERDISRVTRILADQAGLGAAHKSRKLGVTLLAVFGIVGMLGGFVWLAIDQGWFSAIGIGKPGQHREEEKRISLKDIKLSPEEARRLRRILLKGNVERKRSADGNKAAGRQVQQRVELTQEERELVEFYRAQERQKEELVPLATRTPLVASGPARVETAGGYDVPSLPDVTLDSPVSGRKSEVVPESRGRRPLLQGLSELHIKLVVNSHMKRIRRCFERQLKRDARVTGKMTVQALVVPSGEVKKVQIKEEKFRGTIVEECLLKEVAGWRFPAFEGEPYELSFPLLLSPRGGY